jgi:RHS repeat-associated protein
VLIISDQRDKSKIAHVHMNGRVYDPTIGRFISADPTIPNPMYSQAFNRYSYVYNGPLEYVDPSGFDPCPTGGVCGTIPGLPGTWNFIGATSGYQVPQAPISYTGTLQLIIVTANPIIATNLTPAAIDSNTGVLAAPIHTEVGKTVSDPGLQSPGDPNGYGLNIDGSNGVLGAMNETDGATSWDGSFFGGPAGRGLSGGQPVGISVQLEPTDRGMRQLHHDNIPNPHGVGAGPWHSGSQIQGSGLPPGWGMGGMPTEGTEPICISCYIFPALKLAQTLYTGLTVAQTIRTFNRNQGLPPDGVTPPVDNPQDYTPGPATRGNGQSLWGPKGDEWRYFPGDNWHNPHWDYNPWDSWSSPWQNVPIGDLPPVKPSGP